MLQNPNIIEPRKDQISTLENLADIRAWHMSCVEVKAPRNEIAIEAIIKELFHVDSSCRRASRSDCTAILATRRQRLVIGKLASYSNQIMCYGAIGCRTRQEAVIAHSSLAQISSHCVS